MARGDSNLCNRVPSRARPLAARAGAAFVAGVCGAHCLVLNKVGAGLDKQALDGGYSRMARRVCTPPDPWVRVRLRLPFSLCDALPLQQPEHRRLFGEDRGPLLHLQLLLGRDDPRPRCVALPVSFDAVLQLSALRRGANGAGAPAVAGHGLQYRLLRDRGAGGHCVLGRGVHDRSEGVGPSPGCRRVRHRRLGRDPPRPRDEREGPSLDRHALHRKRAAGSGTTT